MKPRREVLCVVAHQVIVPIGHLSVDAVELRCDYLQLQVVGTGREVDLCHLQEEQRLVGSLVVTLLPVGVMLLGVVDLVAASVLTPVPSRRMRTGTTMRMTMGV